MLRDTTLIQDSLLSYEIYLVNKLNLIDFIIF